MNLFRNLLVWILLAIIGALAWHLLAQDPGYVLVRYRGWDYTTNLLWVGVAAVVALFALWLLWALIALPLRAWRQRRDQQSRARLGTGLEALYHGHYARAEKLLPQAGDDSDAAIALLASSRAALARGDHAAARRHLDAIDVRHALTRAIGHAELSLAEERPTDALVALDAPAAQPLPPRGLALRAEALAVSGQAAEAYALLGALRQQQALPDTVLAERELRWSAAAMRQAAMPTRLPTAGNRCPSRCAPSRRSSARTPNAPQPGLGRGRDVEHRTCARHALGRAPGRALRQPPLARFVERRPPPNAGCSSIRAARRCC